ncbi:MAG: site-specific integrase [Gammaproteobacteria bacterium]|nr:site-specific integrase [Gammaproteobacteria bacterium]
MADATRAQVPALFAPDQKSARHFLEFFAANIRNANTRRAYFRNVRQFADWSGAQGFDELLNIEPIHVAADIGQLGTRLAKPSVKQHLAALRMLFDRSASVPCSPILKFSELTRSRRAAGARGTRVSQTVGHRGAH